MDSVLFILGPTTCGKTALSIELAQQLNGEIINVDSSLVYIGMDIGTAKPSKQEQQGIPHHLIDIVEPSAPYDVGQFYHDATRLISEIHAGGKLPILVGGTMLYFYHLYHGIDPLPKANPALRQKIDIAAEEKGWAHLWEELHEINPNRANQIHPNDKQRISRALEIAYGDQPTNQAPLPGIKHQYDIQVITPPLPPRAEIHQRIETRFKLMLEAGFIDEVRRFHQKPSLSLSLPAMRSVGYRQAWHYLDNQIDYQTMVEQSLAATRQLAKRQFTWLKHWPMATTIQLF